MFLPLLAAASTSLWPFGILAISIAAVILMISVFRFHPFIALILAAFLAGFLTPEFPAGVVDGYDAKANHWVAAVELTSVEFGKTAKGVAISIGLAAIVGLCLMESGAADKVVRRFLAVFGEKRAALAILASTYFLSIPIFFDTMFMLMVPLAMALRLRTGKDYLLYVMCICCGGVMTHSLTIPHPGPLFMVDQFKVDAGASMLWGIVAGIIPCGLGYFVAKAINSGTEVPLRDTPGATLDELRGISEKPESELPSFFASVAPIILPIILIALASIAKLSNPEATVPIADLPTWAKVMFFLGNKNIALMVGTAIALWVLARQKKARLRDVQSLLGPPIETAGVIILITAAGGAFGGMIKNAGVGDAIDTLTAGSGISLILLGWMIAVVMRIAVGSATAAMIIASSLLAPMVADVVLPYHKMYLFLAVGFGAFSCSWMNDSGFWVVGRLSGMTERETLRSWTVLLTVNSVIGIILTLIASKLLPLV